MSDISNDDSSFERCHKKVSCDLQTGDLSSVTNKPSGTGCAGIKTS